MATLLITSQIINQFAESVFPYWLQKRHKKRMKKRVCSMKTDTDLSLVEQVNLEKEMGTYFVRFTTVKELKAFWDIVATDISQCNLTCFCLSDLSTYFQFHQFCL